MTNLTRVTAASTERAASLRHAESRKLGTPIDMVEIAMSFAEIGQAIAH